MKIVGSVLFVAACIVASTHSFPSDRDSDLPSGYDISDTMGGTDIFKNVFWRVQPGLSDRDSDLSSGYDISDTMGGTDIFKNVFWRLKTNLNRFSPLFGGQIFKTQSIPLSNMLNWNFTKNDANRTSETKIIDGNVITTNETIYTGNNNYSTLIMRIRIIEVEPENETNPVTEGDNVGYEVVTLPMATESTSESNTGTTNRKESTSSTRSVETVEEFDNEISKDQNPLTA